MKEGASPEMQGVAKLVSGRLQAQVAGPHPDPDVLAAFAENALLDAERAQLLQHLGACNDCREVLYLALPDPAEAQKLLSFQPKRSSAAVFRWGALAASVVIVGAAVIARYPVVRTAKQAPAVANSPVSTYAKVAEEKVPAEEKNVRDSLAPAPEPVRKQRPEEKHMTAKPQAGMQFDDTDQVRLSSSAGSSKKLDEGTATMGRGVAGSLSASNANSVSPSPLASMAAKEKSESRADAGYTGQALTSGGPIAKSGSAIAGTVRDLSGAVVPNAKITISGPAGEETAISDAEGRFGFNSLTAGLYSLKTEASGFKLSEVKNVWVLGNKASTIGVRLEPGATAAAREVSAPETGTSEMLDVTAAAPPTQAISGFAVQGQNQQTMLQKTVIGNSPQSAKTQRPRWTISAEGALERSLDLGKTWQKVSVSDGAVFRAVSVFGADVWAGGNHGILYHSANFGRNWTKVAPATADEKLTLDITHIEFSDPANGTVNTTNGETWATSDGGQTWRRK